LTDLLPRFPYQGYGPRGCSIRPRLQNTRHRGWTGNDSRPVAVVGRPQIEGNFCLPHKDKQEKEPQPKPKDQTDTNDRQQPPQTRHLTRHKTNERPNQKQANDNCKIN
jgi:hypothetical protein